MAVYIPDPHHTKGRWYRGTVPAVHGARVVRTSKGPFVIVIGTSAGGMAALATVLTQLPKGLPAAVFIVQHMSADTTGLALLNHLQQVGTLPCQFGESGPFVLGRAYIAPPDHHMLIKKGAVLITKGARENRSRPSIDPLFRSAAVAYGTRVIGVILTGRLDDGASGLQAIARCGGQSVVQDPEDASYPDMPKSALRHVKVDHCVPVAAMGSLLTTLLNASAAKKQKKPPPDIVLEAKIAERVLSDLAAVDALGDQVPFNCPECGGVLWKVKHGQRFRCHTGHAFTASALANAQSEKIQETLWMSLRMFEERKNLLLTMQDPKSGRFSRSAAERTREADQHIERLRAILLANEQ